jgi:hypothetical protein
MTATCTIVTTATGGVCGKPAVVSWKSRSTGRTFGECAEHAQGAAPGTKVHDPDALAVGDSVSVEHCGVVKHGVVRELHRVNARVEVAVGRGSSARLKTITRPTADLVKWVASPA